MNNITQNNFWPSLPKPFCGLAPMDGITDNPFRIITARYGKPDVIFTEFIAVEALIRGVERAFLDLTYTKEQRPIVAQLYGNTPQDFYSSAQIAAELGFDGIDINMGCPAKSVQARGAGAGLIQTPELAVEIINKVQEAISNWQENGVEYQKFPPYAKPNRTKRRLELLNINNTRKPIPISVKTRLGYDKPDIKWIETIAEKDIQAITIHGRTLKQAYRGKADWEYIQEASKAIRHQNPKIIVIGNGDIKSRDEADTYAKRFEVDGVLIGRSAMGNPWVFTTTPKVSQEKLFDVMLEHAHLHYNQKGPKAFVQMRRILAQYIQGCKQAVKLRSSLVRVNTPKEVQNILKNVDKSKL